MALSPRHHEEDPQPIREHFFHLNERKQSSTIDAIQCEPTWLFLAGLFLIQSMIHRTFTRLIKLNEHREEKKNQVCEVFIYLFIYSRMKPSMWCVLRLEKRKQRTQLVIKMHSIRHPKGRKTSSKQMKSADARRPKCNDESYDANFSREKERERWKWRKKEKEKQYRRGTKKRNTTCTEEKNQSVLPRMNVA